MDTTCFERLTRALAGRRSRRVALAAGGAGLAVRALGRPAAAQEASPAPTETATVLYVQVADGGRFLPASGGVKGGELTLVGVAAHTVWFAERPDHRAGTVRTADFAIGPVFAGADPPNAALVAEVAGEEVVTVVELTNPRYEAAGTVRYDAVPVPGGPGGGVTRGGRPVAAVPEQFGPASLFVDGVTCRPDGNSCSRSSDCCSGRCEPRIIGGVIPDIICV